MNIKIHEELEVFCSIKGPREYHKLRSAALNRYEIIDLLPDINRDFLVNAWCMTDEPIVKTIEIELEFDVTFSSRKEIDDVEIGFESIIDIVSPELEVRILNKAQEEYAVDQADILYHQDLEGKYERG